MFVFYYVDVKCKEVIDLIFFSEICTFEACTTKKGKITSTCEKFNINFELQIFYVDARNWMVRSLEEIGIKQVTYALFLRRPSFI